MGCCLVRADLVSQLVDEDDGAVTLVGVAGDLAQRDTHQARLAADLRCTHTHARRIGSRRRPRIFAVM